MTRLLGLLTALAVLLGPTVVVSPADAAVPPRYVWIKDVNKVMRGSGDYLRERTAAGDPMLAINFDIDNSTIATHYDGRGLPNPIPRVLRFANLAKSLGVALVFNTGRLKKIYKRTMTQLTEAGYEVTMLCMRTKGEKLPHSKQRCRDTFIEAGYTLIANVGNNRTDFVGDGYEKAYRLPNYKGQLS
jgi:hypothetical protein